MPVSRRDNINHREFVKVVRIGATAAMRGGVLTDRQKNALDRIAKKAAEREDAKRNAK